MRFALLLPLVAHLGCAAIAGVDDYVAVDCVGASCADADVAGDSSAAEDAIHPSDAAVATDAPSSDTKAKDSSAIDAGGPPTTCATAPTKLVSLGAWSIDATEVTNAQYAAFLAAKPGPASGQPGYCDWNKSFVPMGAWPAPAARCDFPVVQVDWCDAYAYCAWAKKRLCGSPGGGATPRDGSGPTSAASSQWYAACSGGGTTKYPYGDTVSAGACVDDAYGSGGAVRVGSATACHGTGAYAAVFDLSGNVREWEDDCDATKDGGDNCRARGGGFDDPPDKATCATLVGIHRDTRADDLGFRCCSP